MWYTYLFVGLFSLLNITPNANLGGNDSQEKDLIKVEQVNCNSIEVTLSNEFLLDGKESLVVEVAIADQIWKKHFTKKFDGNTILLKDLEPNTYRLKVLPSNKMKSSYGEGYYQKKYIKHLSKIDCSTKENDSSFMVFPNPANQSIFIGEELEGDYELIIYSTTSKVAQYRINNNSRKLDISPLAAGVYHLVLRNEQETKSTKFIKIN